MHLGSLRDVLLRHWPLTIAALCLTCAGMFQITSMVKPQYTTTGSVVLIPPPTPDEPLSNRYLALGTLDQAEGVVIRSLTSEQTHNIVAAAASGGTYEVVPDYTTSAPILVVTATGDSRRDTERVLAAALAEVPKVLSRLQRSIGVDPTQQITTQSLTSDLHASIVLKPVIRAMLGVGVLLMAICLGLIALLDGIQMQRRRRRAPRPAEPGPPTGVDDQSAPVVVDAERPTEDPAQGPAERLPRPQRFPARLSSTGALSRRRRLDVAAVPDVPETDTEADAEDAAEAG